MALTDMVMMPGEDYQAACDKLREKTGTTDAIKSGDWPGLLDSIGGGDIDALIDRSITEIHSNAESIGNYAFYNCAALTTADFPVATSIGTAAFQSCGKLATADFPAVTSIGTYTFYNCGTLATADFPVATRIGNEAFQFCGKLTTADFPVATSIGNKAFQSCGKLQSFILRNTEQVCTLSNTYAFNSTPITSGTGYIYVPRALVDSYKAATNWSTYADQIRALEDYTVDGTTTGALDETKI